MHHIVYRSAALIHVLGPYYGPKLGSVNGQPTPSIEMSMQKYPYVSGTCAADFGVLKHSGNNVYHLLSNI